MQGGLNLSSANLSFCVCEDKDVRQSSTAYATFNFFLIIIAVPIISVFGLYSNSVNFLIYSRQQMCHNSGNRYLAALAVSDFFVVLSGMFIFFIDSARSYLQPLNEAVLPAILVFLPFGYVVQSCSVYFTVALSLDCYLRCTKHPSWCKDSRANQVIIGVVSFAILYNVLRFLQLELKKCLEDQHMTVKYEICPTPLAETVNEAYNVYSYMVVMVCAPFILLSLLNTLVIVQQQRDKRKIPFGDNNDNTVESENTTAMVMVVMLFLSCNVLGFVINIVETFWPVTYEVINFMTDTSNFLTIFNSSMNFLIYLKFDLKYRRLYIVHCCGLRGLVRDSQPPVAQELDILQRLNNTGPVGSTPDRSEPTNEWNSSEMCLFLMQQHRTAHTFT